MADLTEMFGEVIYAYTRAQAIEDGTLVDVTATAREAGFRIPVALTSAAWADAVTWEYGGTQDEAGRLWDVLWMAHCAAVRNRETDRFTYTFLRVPNSEGAQRAMTARLSVIVGPGDEAEPVITIGLPGED